MELTVEQAEARLSHPDNLRFLAKEEVPTPELQIKPTNNRVRNPRGNHKGNTLNKHERTELTVRARLGEKQKDLAEEFGVTQAAVSYLERTDAKGTDKESIHSVVARYQESIEQAKDLALTKVMCALNLITEDKLTGESPRSLAAIVGSLAGAVDKITPRNPALEASRVSVTVYAPEQRKVTDFNVVEIG